MVRADVKLPLYPCSLPVSLFPELSSSSSQRCCCLLVFLFPPGRVGGQGGSRVAAAPHWDLGPRGDYPQGWSCVCAVPASPGPFRHGLTPGSQRTPGKASYLPAAPARPRSDCHLRRHLIPKPLLLRPGAPPGRDHAGLFQGVLPLPQQIRVGKGLSSIKPWKWIWGQAEGDE